MPNIRFFWFTYRFSKKIKLLKESRRSPAAKPAQNRIGEFSAISVHCELRGSKTVALYIYCVFFN